MDKPNLTNFAKLHGFASLLGGMLLGGLAGIATAILFTPQSGKQNRAQVRIKSAELQERATDTLEELIIISQFDNRKILARTGGKSESSRN